MGFESKLSLEIFMIIVLFYLNEGRGPKLFQLRFRSKKGSQCFFKAVKIFVEPLTINFCLFLYSVSFNAML